MKIFFPIKLFINKTKKLLLMKMYVPCTYRSTIASVAALWTCMYSTIQQFSTSISTSRYIFSTWQVVICSQIKTILKINKNFFFYYTCTSLICLLENDHLGFPRRKLLYNLLVFPQGQDLSPDLGQGPQLSLWHIFSQRWFPQESFLPHGYKKKSNISFDFAHS